jgi:hypothetical protein
MGEYSKNRWTSAPVNTSARVSFTTLDTPVYIANVRIPMSIASTSTDVKGRAIIKITEKKIPKSLITTFFLNTNNE